jgi:hypothetical protein
MSDYITGTYTSSDGKLYKFRAPAIFLSEHVVKMALDKLNAEIKLGLR